MGAHLFIVCFVWEPAPAELREPGGAQGYMGCWCWSDVYKANAFPAVQSSTHACSLQFSCSSHREKGTVKFWDFVGDPRVPSSQPASLGLPFRLSLNASCPSQVGLPSHKRGVASSVAVPSFPALCLLGTTMLRTTVSCVTAPFLPPPPQAWLSLPIL